MRNFTIKNKIIAMIFGITVLALTLGFSIIVVIHINTMKEEMINNTSLHAKQVGDQSISPITFNDKEGIKEILSKLNTIPYIEFAQIVDAKSKILGSYSKDNEIVQITNAPKVSVHEFKNNHLYVSEPIVFENQFLGTVFLRAGTVLMYNKIKDFTISSIILCLFLVVLSYFLAFWFQNIISKPILKLAKLTHQISKDANYSVHIEKQNNDEIGNLYDEFNTMLEQIEIRQNARDFAEAALKESEEKFKKISESAFDAIIVFDQKGLVTYWNQAACNIFGYSESEILTKEVYKYLIHHKFSMVFVENMNSFTKTGTNPFLNSPFEFSAIKKDGSEFPIDIVMAAFSIKNIWHIVATIRDISVRKQIERDLIKAKEKAEESDKLKSAFLANMSHEIRTPMNAIIGFSELLGKQDVFSKQKDKFLAYIINSGKTLLSLIDDIIDVSKIEAGQLKIKKQECAINGILYEIFESFNQQRERNNHTFQFRLNKGVDEINFSVNTDPIRFKQIFTNLIGNAFKFTEIGFVEFGYRLEKPNEILFYVKDTGIGISSDKYDLIFDRFGQVDSSYSKNQGGTGLGLTISKKLTELLGGNMWVDSAVNEGSTFYFTLPYQSSEKIKLNLTANRNLSNTLDDFSSKTILIVEDEEMNYTFIYETLLITNCITVWAKNGREAVEFCKSNHIDLILMDIKMPEMDGFEATQLIKQMKPSIPIIAQTAYAMSTEKEKSIEAGCDDYITKPIIIAELLSVLRKYLA